MSDELIYLDTYILQRDMRIRMPKSILSNLNVQNGKSKFDIFYDKANSCLVLKVKNKPEENNEQESK